MYHSAGIDVYLFGASQEVTESGYPRGYDPAGDDANDCRALIHVEPGIELTFVIELEDDFRFYSAAGLKFTVAIGHDQQEPYALEDVQAWYIPKHEFEGLGIAVSELQTWEPATSRRRVFPLRIPAPEAFRIQDVQNDNWKETYNANKGCISVFVVRGNLTGETDNDRQQFPTDPPEAARATAAVEIHPIRWEWFEELRSENGEAFMFEFRNLGHTDFQSMDLQLLADISDSSDSEDESDTSDEEEDDEDEEADESESLSVSTNIYDDDYNGHSTDGRDSGEGAGEDGEYNHDFNADATPRRSKRARTNRFYGELHGRASTSARSPRPKRPRLSQPSSGNPCPNTRSQTNARTLSHEGNEDNPTRSSTARAKVSSGQSGDRDSDATNHRGGNVAAGTHTPALLPTPGPTDTPTPAQGVRPANPGNSRGMVPEGGGRQQNASRDAAHAAETGCSGNAADIDAEGGGRQQSASGDGAQEAGPGHTCDAAVINVEGERRQQSLAREAAQEKKRAKRSLEISRARLRLMEEEDEYKNRFPESDEE